MPNATAVPPEALAVLQRFLDASTRRDADAMRACLCKSSLESGQFADSGPEGVRYEIGAGAMEGEIAVIPASAFPIDTTPPAPSPAQPGMPVMQLPCVLLREEGAWKIDLAQTMERMLGGNLGDIMSKAVSAMGDAMGQITETLGQTMQQAFGESGASTDAPPADWCSADTAYAPEEFLPPYPMEPLPKTAAALSAAVGSPVIVECAMADLLKQLGSSERDVLFNWFDDSLFAAWDDLLSRMARHEPPVPLTGRLRALRIEPAKWIDDRCLVLDGSDLVYRMFLNSTDGYYSDAQVLELLPGLLAGLPETPDPAAAGKRLIPTDQEEMPLDVYLAHSVPRFMRRISDLLNKNVALRANWDDFHDPRDARQIYRWALNRVLGGVALACLDPARKAQLAAELAAIDLQLVATVDERRAQFTGGALTIGLDYYRGEKGGFYEGDIARVLAGEVIQYASPEGPAEETAADAPEPAASTEHMPDEEPTEENAPPSTPAELNDELFTSAVKGLNETVPVWAQQLEMALGHPVALRLDFDSLAGQYDLVQPFIHQALTGALESLTPLCYDPAFKPKLQPIESVVITALAPSASCNVEWKQKELTFRVPLLTGDHRAPTAELAATLKKCFA